MNAKPFGPPTRFLIMAIWFGLGAGFSEVLFRGLNKLLLLFLNAHKITFEGSGVLLLQSRLFNINPHSFWMIPLAELCLFSLLGCCLFLLANFWPRLISLRVTIFLLTFTAFLTIGLIFRPPLHLIAVVLLGLGLATQVSRIVESRTNAFYVFVRRTLPWMLAAIPTLALGIYAWKKIPEYRALAQLPSAKPEAANVLLIVLDTVRAQSMSVYNYNRPTTPRLEQFAKTGVRFERALSTSPWTLPAHATMFTGRFPHEVFSDWETPLNGITRFEPDYPTLAEILGNRGYVTAGFVANTFYCAYTHGLDRGFAHYEDFQPSLRAFIKNSPLSKAFLKVYHRMKGTNPLTIRKSATDINRDFLDWLNQAENQRPFFVFLNYFDAHAPYLPPEPKFDSGKSKNDTSPEHRASQEAYDQCIAYLDEELGVLLDTLKKKGVLENTLVIITSDHGEQFGEHGLTRHANSLYRQVLQVPLLISFPKVIPAGITIPESVSLRDLPATVVDLLEIEGDNKFPGKSLARYWHPAVDASEFNPGGSFAEVLVGDENPSFWSKSLPGYEGGMKSVIADNYHYIKYAHDGEELYDFDNDPEEERDLANTNEGRLAIERLRFALEAILADSRGKATVGHIAKTSTAIQ